MNAIQASLYLQVRKVVDASSCYFPLTRDRKCLFYRLFDNHLTYRRVQQE